MSTGIVRRIDELGRIVIPKEIRKNLRIKNGDNLEINLNGDSILLKKYSQIEKSVDFISAFVNSFYEVLKYNIIVTDTDKIISIAGDLSNKYEDNEISSVLSNMIERRDSFVERKKKDIEISPGMIENGYYAISTIINNGDAIGLVLILSLNTPMMEQEEQLTKILASMLSNYFSL